MLLTSTHLPLSKSELLLSSALGLQALLLLKGPADGTGGNGEVAVVTVGSRHPVRLGQASVGRNVSSKENSRKASGFPGEHHLDGLGCGGLRELEVIRKAQRVNRQSSIAQSDAAEKIPAHLELEWTRELCVTWGGCSITCFLVVDHH